MLLFGAGCVGWDFFPSARHSGLGPDVSTIYVPAFYVPAFYVPAFCVPTFYVPTAVVSCGARVKD